MFHRRIKLSKVNTKMRLSHTWCSFAPPQLLVWCLAGSQSQIIFWWWVECRITCSYKTTTEAAYCTRTRGSRQRRALLLRVVLLVNRPFTSASTCTRVEENSPGQEICSKNLQVFLYLKIGKSLRQ